MLIVEFWRLHFSRYHCFYALLQGHRGLLGSGIVLRGTGCLSHCSLDQGSAVRPVVLYFVIDNRNQLHFDQLKALAAILSEESVLG
jgi:hypothetical protein